MLTHKLLYADKKDYSFMCMELLLAVMFFVYDYRTEFFQIPVIVTNFENVFNISNGKRPAFSTFFKEKFEKITFTRHQNFHDDPISYILPNKANLYGAIIFTWFWMHKKNNNVMVQHMKQDAYEVISNNHEELKKFAQTINIIS